MVSTGRSTRLEKYCPGMCLLMCACVHTHTEQYFSGYVDIDISNPLPLKTSVGLAFCPSPHSLLVAGESQQHMDNCKGRPFSIVL